MMQLVVIRRTGVACYHFDRLKIARFCMYVCRCVYFWVVLGRRQVFDHCTGFVLTATN